MKKFIVFALMEILVFGLVGAPLWTGAGLSLFVFAFWQTDFSTGTLREMAGLFIAVLPYTITYSSAMALFDVVLAGLKVPYRQMACALAGLCSMVWLFADLGQPMKLISIGLLGALPAALCSWICTMIARRAVAGDPPPQLEANAASPG